MTVSSTLNKHIYVGDGSNKNFPFTFYALSSNDIKLYLTDTLTKITTQITSNYTVSPTSGTFPSVGGTVTYPVSGTAITSQYSITLLRSMEELQPTVYPNNTSLKPKVIEISLDRITMIVQQQQEELNRSLKYSVSDTDTIASVSEFVASIESNVASTAASATAAANSEIAAENSATDAANSEANAINASNSATASATISTTKASEAAISATNAASSAANAFAATAPAWSATTTYNYPTVVAYTDGYTYRCIGTNVVGDIPSTSINWVRLAIVTNDFFDIDENGDLMPALSPTYSSDFELDQNGDIMPKK